MQQALLRCFNCLLVTIPILLIGCSTVHLSEEQKMNLSNLANKPVYCEGGDDCEIKWGRAITWVLQNSYWKIKVQSDSLITTEGPLNTVYAAYQVQKVPLGNNKYLIDMRLGCGNPFGCVPSVLELKASFVQFVAGYDSQQATASSIDTALIEDQSYDLASAKEDVRKEIINERVLSFLEATKNKDYEKASEYIYEQNMDKVQYLKSMEKSYSAYQFEILNYRILETLVLTRTATVDVEVDVAYTSPGSAEKIQKKRIMRYDLAAPIGWFIIRYTCIKNCEN